jgi:uncharacterized protein YgiM (DUF1202 family)
MVDPTGTSGRIGRVIRDYESPYRDPVVVRKGESLTVGDRTTHWEGWIWCTTRNGKSRWFPASFLEDTGDLVTLLRDYEATELSVRVGEQLALGEDVAGWIWCTNEEGRSGWVPADHLETP